MIDVVRLLKNQELFEVQRAREENRKPRVYHGVFASHPDNDLRLTEVVKAAETRAYQILDTAEAEARRLRHEVEDFCDQKLASFEIVLERTLKMVSSGRAKLQGTNLTADIPLDQPAPEGHGDAGGYARGDDARNGFPAAPGALFPD